MPDHKQSFAVVIPTANRSSFVCEAVERALVQTTRPAEVIVVDDGSSDDTCAAVRSRFGGQVQLIEQRKAGVQAARNRGVAAANSEWIAFSDDDDLWDIDYLEKADSFVHHAPEIGAIFTSFRVSESDEITLSNKFSAAPASFWDIPESKDLGEGRLVAAFPLEKTFDFQPFFPSTTIIRCSVFKSLGGYDPTLRGFKGEDFEFTFRILKEVLCGFQNVPGATIRKHASNDSGNSSLMTIGELQVLEFLKETHRGTISNHVLGCLNRAISHKLPEAFEAAFNLGNPRLVRTLASKFQRPLTLKERMKASTSLLPDYLAALAMRYLGGAGTLQSEIRKRQVHCD